MKVGNSTIGVRDRIMPVIDGVYRETGLNGSDTEKVGLSKSVLIIGVVDKQGKKHRGCAVLISITIHQTFKMDTIAKWLRRQIRIIDYLFLSEGAGSNPAGVVKFSHHESLFRAILPRLYISETTDNTTTKSSA